VRHVTSSFIEHEGNILLLKGSNKVRSYQECWAVVSGSIEKGETPLQCARREIKEELSLTGDQVIPIRSGSFGTHPAFILLLTFILIFVCNVVRILSCTKL